MAGIVCRYVVLGNSESSSCIYPELVPHPVLRSTLWTRTISILRNLQVAGCIVYKSYIAVVELVPLVSGLCS